MNTKKITITLPNNFYNKINDYFESGNHSALSIPQLLVQFINESFDKRTNSYTAIAKQKIEYKKIKENITPLEKAQAKLEEEKAKEKAQIMMAEAEVVERGGYVCIDPDGGTLLVGILPVYKNNTNKSVRIDYKEKVYLDELHLFPRERQFHHSDTKPGAEAKQRLEAIMAKSGQSFDDEDLTLKNPNIS